MQKVLESEKFTHKSFRETPTLFWKRVDMISSNVKLNPNPAKTTFH